MRSNPAYEPVFFGILLKKHPLSGAFSGRSRGNLPYRNVMMEKVMKMVSVISRGAVGLALTACLCASGTAQAREFFRGPGVFIPVPIPIVRDCGFGFHRVVVRDYYGRVIERCLRNDPYRRY